MKTQARMARDAGTLLLSRLAEGAISFAFSAWTVRLVSKEELSLWPVLGLLAGFSASLAGLGLPMAGVRLIPAHLAKGERKRLRAYCAPAWHCTRAFCLPFASCW